MRKFRGENETRIGPRSILTKERKTDKPVVLAPWSCHQKKKKESTEGGNAKRNNLNNVYVFNRFTYYLHAILHYIVVYAILLDYLVIERLQYKELNTNLRNKEHLVAGHKHDIHSRTKRRVHAFLSVYV